MSAISSTTAQGLARAIELNKTVADGYEYVYVASNNTIEKRYTGVFKNPNPIYSDVYAQGTVLEKIPLTQAPTNSAPNYTLSNPIVIICLVALLLFIVKSSSN